MIAAGIKRLLYTEVSNVKGDLKPAGIKDLIAGATEVTNIHGDTWNLEEAEASIEKYKNELTGSVYRENAEPGELTMNFTIGEYSYETKADLMGGELILGEAAEDEVAPVVGWKRLRGYAGIEKCLIAQTKDNQWVIFPRGSVSTREASTDKAIGLAVVGSALEPVNPEIQIEYWIDGEEVK